MEVAVKILDLGISEDIKNLQNDTKLLVPLVYENSISHKYIAAVPNRKDSMSFPKCIYATLSFCSTFTN